MLTLLKNIECCCPKPIGKKDLLIAGDKIEKLLPAGSLLSENCAALSGLIGKTYDCGGLTAWPGLIDQHVHILGGGGEQGFASRVREITVDEIISAGVTTVVGLLGADGTTRSLAGLYAKAKALEAQGISSYTYSGSYALPPVTMTGSITNDLALVDKVIGAGEIAIADHRSSQPDLKGLLKLAADTHLGGLLGGKAGVLHLHVGDGRSGLILLRELIGQSDLPVEMFVPTHVNRNPALFEQAMEYCRLGGNIDLTAGEKAGIPVPQAIRRLIDAGVDLQRVTVSSDANGSIPGGGVANIRVLFDDVRDCILQSGVSTEAAFGLVTENVARILKIHPQKGALQEGCDADILIIDKNFNVRMLFCMGKLLLASPENSPAV